MNNNLYNLFCALVLYSYNIHTLHWKVKGLDFGTKHELFDEYYEELNKYVDDVAEILMMVNQTNIPTLVEVIEHTKETEDSFILVKGDTYYSAKETISKAKNMFDHLIKLYSNVIEDESIPSDITSKLEEHQYWLRKESLYKLTSTLK